MDGKPPSRFILWIERTTDRARLETPAALFTACTIEELARWRAMNPWGDTVPELRWNRDGDGWAYQPPSEYGDPWAIDGLAPPSTQLGHVPDGYPAPASTTGDGAQRIERTCFSARDIALAIEGPVWEICADASGGVLACGIACARGGSAVAMGTGAPPLLATTMARRLGLHISSRRTPRKGQR